MIIQTYVRPWFCRPKLVEELGLLIDTIVDQETRRRAHWLLCQTCGDGVLCLKCTHDGWDVGKLFCAEAHAPSIAQALSQIFKGLAVFRCPNGCNKSTCDSPPGNVLAAILEDDHHLEVAASRASAGPGGP